MRRVVHTIVHIALSVVENVLGVVHIVPWPFVIYIYFVREFVVQDVLYLHTPSVTVDCRQL